jgi:ABC-2 type transport system permease protein
MITPDHKPSPINRFFQGIREIINITAEEFRTIRHDSGLLILLIIAPLIYPPVYCTLYRNETLRDVPVAVVDLSQSPLSRELVRNLDATADLKTAYRFNTMAEAKNALDKRLVHGVILIPGEFSEKINHKEQATVSVYIDMSSFLYYRAMMTACNYTVVNMDKDIQVERLNDQGITGENAEISASPFTTMSTILFNEGTGFASFLMPAILILIIHQTLFFGIGMRAGISREENRLRLVVPGGSHYDSYKVVAGKALAYFIIYSAFTFYILGFIPKVFSLPHIGNFTDVLRLMVPFLLATIFFSMTVSVFIRNRETGLVIFLFCSLILLFLSGFSWPQSNISGFWRALGMIFPSTHGIQGYIKINTMGGTMNIVKKEYVSLWVLTGIYSLTTLIVYRLQELAGRRRMRTINSPAL